MPMLRIEPHTSFKLSREQVLNLLYWMKVCSRIIDGIYYEDVPYTVTEARTASLATRKVLEADGCHIEYESGEFIAYRNQTRTGAK